jgi:hypothetical protein
VILQSCQATFRFINLYFSIGCLVFTDKDSDSFQKVAGGISVALGILYILVSFVTGFPDLNGVSILGSNSNAATNGDLENGPIALLNDDGEKRGEISFRQQ